MHPFWSNLVWWAYAFVWAPFALCTGLYLFRSPWQSTAVGRALMTLLSSLTAVLTFVLVVLAVDLNEGITDLLRGLTLGAVGLGGWMLLRQLIQLQKKRDDNSLHPRRRSTDLI